LFRALLVVLIVALLAMLIHMGYVVWRVTRPTVRTPGASGASGGLHLEDARAHRERADQLAAAGRYVEALAHRFVALVLDLDRRDALKFHPAKTPAEYAREARLDGSGRASLSELVARLYAHVFGAVPCDEHGYREFAAQAELVLDQVVRFVRGGGRVVAAGWGGGITSCVGWRLVYPHAFLRGDSLAVASPRPGLSLPAVTNYLRPPRREELDTGNRSRGGDADAC